MVPKTKQHGKWPLEQNKTRSSKEQKSSSDFSLKKIKWILYIKFTSQVLPPESVRSTRRPLGSTCSAATAPRTEAAEATAQEDINPVSCLDVWLVCRCVVDVVDNSVVSCFGDCLAVYFRKGFLAVHKSTGVLTHSQSNITVFRWAAQRRAMGLWLTSSFRCRSILTSVDMTHLGGLVPIFTGPEPCPPSPLTLGSEICKCWPPTMHCLLLDLDGREQLDLHLLQDSVDLHNGRVYRVTACRVSCFALNSNASTEFLPI